MALVPYIGGAVVPAAVSQSLTTAVANASSKNPKAAARAIRKIAEIHAEYGVPTLSKAGPASTGIGLLKNYRNEMAPARKNRPSPRIKGRGSTLSVSTAPVAVGTTTRMPGVPSVTGSREYVQVTHTALFGSLTGNTSYQAYPYRVNPGLSELFPWLSSLAGSFDMYRIKSLRIRYVPVTGTDTDGAVYLSWDPDPIDSVPITKTQQMAQSVAVTGPAWKPLSVNVPSLGLKYIRRGDVTGTTLNTYDNGVVFVATAGSPAQLVGDLYVDYVIEMHLPHIVSDNYWVYQPQYFKKRLGVISKASPLGTLPPTCYGPVLADPNSFSYPSSGIVKFTIQNCASYVDASGVRYYRMVLDLYAAGTGLVSPTMTGTYSYGLPIAISLISGVIDGTSTGIWNRWQFYWQVSGASTSAGVSLAGATISIDWSAVTTITSTSMVLSQVGATEPPTVNT